MEFLRRLRTLFDEEGWRDVNLRYLGGLYVSIPFQKPEDATRFFRRQQGYLEGLLLFVEEKGQLDLYSEEVSDD